jgi:hypothetical protein
LCHPLVAPVNPDPPGTAVMLTAKLLLLALLCLLESVHYRTAR